MDGQGRHLRAISTHTHTVPRHLPGIIWETERFGVGKGWACRRRLLLPLWWGRGLPQSQSDRSPSLPANNLKTPVSHDDDDDVARLNGLPLFPAHCSASERLSVRSSRIAIAPPERHTGRFANAVEGCQTICRLARHSDACWVAERCHTSFACAE